MRTPQCHVAKPLLLGRLGLGLRLGRRGLGPGGCWLQGGALRPAPPVRFRLSAVWGCALSVVFGARKKLGLAAQCRLLHCLAGGSDVLSVVHVSVCVCERNGI